MAVGALIGGGIGLVGGRAGGGAVAAAQEKRLEEVKRRLRECEYELNECGCVVQRSREVLRRSEEELKDLKRIVTALEDLETKYCLVPEGTEVDKGMFAYDS